MRYETFRLRLERLQSLIRRQYTGNAAELAEKMGVSRRTLFNDLEYLRTGGLKIKYSAISHTYYFADEDDKVSK